jgi:hypothetical protein
MATPSEQPPISLDHIIFLVPNLTSLPPSFSKHFTLTPGGKHADGVTENILIPLRSGIYIELIAFTSAADPASRASHWWGGKPPGWIDWALTSADARDVEAATARAQTGTASSQGRQKSGGGGGGDEAPSPPPAPALGDDGAPWYGAGRRGGRNKPDGTRIEWVVTFPRVPPFTRGEVPFWCHDVTPRELRVPGGDEQVVHASGAVGVAEIRIAAGREQVRAYADGYAGIAGTQVVGLAADGGGGCFAVPLSNPLDGKVNGAPRIVVGPPRDESEENRLTEQGAVLVEVVFLVDGDKEVPDTVVEDIEGQSIKFSFRK